MTPPFRQKSLRSYFSAPEAERDELSKQPQQLYPVHHPTKKLRRKLLVDGSHFGVCPLCLTSLPVHRLLIHASNCQGSQQQQPEPSPCDAIVVIGRVPRQHYQYSQPLPGLFLYQDFITVEEEREILRQLDGTTTPHQPQSTTSSSSTITTSSTTISAPMEFIPWKTLTFNGAHYGKRWGVHCNLRDRCVSAADVPLPHFMTAIILPKLRNLPPMMGCTPNEANAIDYRKAQGHHLQSHVDDRKLSKEPIANLSLAGDCYMTFRNMEPNRNISILEQKVLLRRRCIQILTGRARYDYAHGIDNKDLLSNRRVSITMRESPLTNA